MCDGAPPTLAAQSQTKEPPTNPGRFSSTTYFRHGVSKATFKYLSYYTWHRVIGWLRRKYRRSTWKQLRRRHLGNGWWPAQGGVTLFNPAAVPVTRYRYRGTRIPTPWDGWTTVEAG